MLVVLSGTETFFFSHNPATCDNTPATSSTLADRDDAAMGRNGNFLMHTTLTSSFTSSIVIEPLSNGLPSGATFSAPLPQPAFAVIGDPSRNGGYALGFFGTITRFSVDLQNQTVTVGAPFASSSLNAAAVSQDGTRLYETTFTPPQRCTRPLDAAGDPSGPRVCTADPLSQTGDGQIAVPR